MPATQPRTGLMDTSLMGRSVPLDFLSLFFCVKAVKLTRYWASCALQLFGLTHLCVTFTRSYGGSLLTARSSSSLTSGIMFFQPFLSKNCHCFSPPSGASSVAGLRSRVG